MKEIEKIIDWFKERMGNVTYSRDNRTGPNSYDCSSSVYYSVCEALGIKIDWVRSTATLPAFLKAHGFEKIAENSNWHAERGDIIIWAKKKGVPGESAHTGVFVDNGNIIHCNYSANGISINSEKSLSSLYNWHYEVYRLKEKNIETNEKNGHWKSNSQGFWYEYSDGTYPTNKWLKIDNEWYYFDEKNGYAYQNKWFNYCNNWYYFDNSCKMVYGRWKKISDESYFFSDDGKAYMNEWLNYNGNWYYFDKDCKMLKSKFFNIGGEIFYVDEEGRCILSKVMKIDNKTYAFDERGVLLVNKIINEKGEIIEKGV